MMDQTQVRSFVERYLRAMNCQIIESTPGMIDVKLSIEADQALLNRPFYWMYVEQMNLPANPAQFRFFFEETEESRDFYSDQIHFGAPRFKRMLDSAQKQGRFVRLYQQSQPSERTLTAKSYHPVLAVNYHLAYICDQKKDRINDLAIDLQTGEVHPSFYTWAKEQQWTPQLPPSRFLLPFQLTLHEAVGRLEAYLQREVEQEDHGWAEQARKRLADEVQQIESYYPEEHLLTDDQRQEKHQRLRETVWQLAPRIEITVINAGLFYLDRVPFFN